MEQIIITTDGKFTQEELIKIGKFIQDKIDIDKKARVISMNSQSEAFLEETKESMKKIIKENFPEKDFTFIDLIQK